MRLPLLPALLVLAAGQALAEPAPAPAAPQADGLPMHALAGDGRYQLMEINDRIVRLDTETGHFELCRMEGDAWTCLLAADERDRLNATIADLTKRVAALEAASRAQARAAAANAPQPSPATTHMATPAPQQQAAAEPVPATPAPAAPAPQAALPQVPVPAVPVPQVPVPPTAGAPVDISPAAVEPESKPGLIRRLADRIGHIGW